MHSNGRLWTTAIIALVLGIVAGSAAMALAERDREAKLEHTLTSVMQRLEASEGKVKDLSSELEDAPAATSAAPSSAAGAANPVPPTSKQFVFIKSVSRSGAGRLVVDYATFLTGEAAAAAASRAGEESPPPNDYFIVNDSDELTTIPLDKQVVVRLATKPGEGAVVGGYDSSVDALATYLEADSEETAALRTNGFWLTLQDEHVTRIEEQYAP